MGLGILEIIVLLVVCALVIAALRNPSWKSLVVLPVAILLLLGISSIVFALVAHRSRDVPATTYVQQPGSWADHVERDLDLAADKTSRDLDMAADRFSHEVSGPVGAKMLLLIVPVMLAIALFVTIPILCRKWILEHRAIMIPTVCVLGVAFVAAAAVGSVGVYMARSSVISTEESRRAEIVHQLRAIGESLHQSSARDKTVPVAAVQPAAVENSESAADAAASVSGSSDEGAPSESPVAADTPTATTADTAPAPAALPDWIRGHELEVNDLTRTPVLLASEQWSTVQESEVQIEQLASVAVLHQLRQQRPDLAGWRPNNDFIQQTGAIRQRFVEQTSLKVGEFESPMYRSYWQVAVTPQVSELAYSQWKATAIETRVIGLGGGAAAITLVFAAIAAGLRLDLATSGRYRRHMFAAAGFLTSLGAGMLLFS